MNRASKSTLRQGVVTDWRWLLPLITISLLIVVLSLWAYRLFSAEIRDEAVRTLAGIAEEKRLTIERWLADNDSDARTFFAGTSVTLLLLNEWIAGGRQDEALLDRLRARLEEVAQERGWGGLTLYDERGEPLMVIGDAGSRVPTERVQDLLHRPRFERLDAQPGADGVWRNGLLAPVGNVGAQPLGVVSLTWSLEQALNPVLAHWPIPSDSAGTALIRREGDTVRFILTQDHRIPAGEQRTFHEWPRLLAVQAAQGMRGIIEGALDYRGEAILGFAVPIAGTSWILLSKIDQHEAGADLRQLAVDLTLATLLALILLNGAVFGLWRWDQRRRAAIVEEREQGMRRREQQTRRLLDAILTSTADAVFAKDLQGRYQLANHTCAAQLGLTVEQVLGRRDDELLPPAVAAAFQEEDRRVLAGETFVNLEQRWVLSGKEGTFLTTKAPLRDAEGAIVGLYGIVRDISDRQRQEDNLRAAEATAARLQGELRWKEALDAAGHGVWEFDIRGGRLEFSPTIARLLGLEPAELSPDLDAWLQRQHPDEREAIAAQLRAALASKQGHYEARHRVRHRDGNWRWFLTRGLVSERGPDGAPWRMIGTLTDITAWQEAEERLRESEERARRQWIELEAIYTTAPVGLFVLDRELRFLRLNERLAEMNGLPIADHLGRRVREIVPDLADTAEPLFQGVIDRAEPLLNIPLSGETAAQPGIRRHWREHLYPMKDDSGQVVGINGVVEEITEIKRIEEEIRALNTDLEAKVAARTAEANAASQAKSEFLSHMSHEIRTPLNGVLGLTQLLAREPLTVAQQELVARIQDAGRSLLAIINDILDFSKIEAGQLRLEARPFRLEEVAHKVENLLRPVATTKGLDLRLEPPTEPLDGLLGDALRLEQVLINLIGNAIKFTERGAVTLRIARLEGNGQGARLRFEVRDTGIGMDAATLAGLFQPFTQAEAGITRRFGGTGLGLSISKRLVELMGGAIGVESAPGVGSVFWFELPFDHAQAGAAEAPAVPVSERPAGPRLPGLRLLAVDDSPMNRDLVERALTLEGAQVVLAADGQQAVQRLQTPHPDIDAVLMDVQMPVMDGRTATRLIRDRLGLKDLPVIALTAGVLAEEQRAIRDAGADEVLAKPLDLEQLVATLLRLIPAPALSAAAQNARPGVAATASPWDDAMTSPRVEAITRAGGDATADSRVPPTASTRDDATISPPISATASTVAPASGDFPLIAAIDREHAALVTGHDRAFFLTQLARLLRDSASMAAETRLALLAGDRETAARRMHSLKGNAGNLGALALMQAAAALETAIQDQTRDLETANKEQTMDREIASQGLAPDLDAGLTDLERQLQDLATASAPWLAGRDARGQVGWKAAMIPAGMPLKVPSGGQPDVQTQAQAQAARSAEAAGEGAAPVPTPSLATARLAALRDALQRHDLAAQDHYEELAPTLAAAWGEPETQALGEAIADLRFGAALAQLDRRVPSAAMDGAGNG